MERMNAAGRIVTHTGVDRETVHSSW